MWLHRYQTTGVVSDLPCSEVRIGCGCTAIKRLGSFLTYPAVRSPEERPGSRTVTLWTSVIVRHLRNRFQPATVTAGTVPGLGRIRSGLSGTVCVTNKAYVRDVLLFVTHGIELGHFPNKPIQIEPVEATIRDTDIAFDLIVSVFEQLNANSSAEMLSYTMGNKC